MDIDNIIPHIEALIFASDKPITNAELADLANNAFGLADDKITPEQVAGAVESIAAKYQEGFYPFEMRESGGGWQFLTKKDFHKTVAQLNGEKFLKRLSSASLETLAIIAYKQPITKGEVESIRGVNSDYSIQKLLEKELIIITGRNEALPGKPLVYTTSRSFMDYFGINSAEELPRIREVLADQEVKPTPVKQQQEANGPEPPLTPEETADDLAPGTEQDDDNTLLVVRGNGELTEEPNVVVDEDTDAVDPGVLDAATEEEQLTDQINREMESGLGDGTNPDEPAGDKE